VADAEGRLTVEMNSVTDNPLVFVEDGDVLSGGNFHGEPIALTADCLALGAAELGSISERRIEKLTFAAFSGLPPFLAADPGLDSGFMIAQVTAASAVGELRVLAHPASVDSIPTSAGKEDHVSMGMGAALKLHQALTPLRRILAIELVTAAQAIELLRPLRSSEALEALYAALRERVAPWREDHPMADDLEAGDRFLAEAVDAHLDGLL
ncbi:MAG: aromatic amino acid lyase, partial [Thermoanaerobaculia bacterium]